jgi:hypothetical protein
MSRRMLSLVAVVATVGSLVLLGCPGDNNHENPATASDLNNRSFSFSSGKAFHPALTNVPTVVSFSDNGTNFTLTNAPTVVSIINNATNFMLQATVQNVVRTATGTYGIDSCLFRVGNSSNPTAPGGGSDFPVGTGPQPTDTINLVICDFDRTNNRLTLFDGTNTVTGSLVP